MPPSQCRSRAAPTIDPVLVLALDTSTPHVTAAVVTVRRPHELIDGVGELLEARAERVVHDGRAHVEQLMPSASAVLAEIGARPADLDAIVVGLGPGPFTGLRVGIATAAALGDALDLPVHGVPSHDGFAAAVVAAGQVDGPFGVVTDARRKEVHLSVYTATGKRIEGPGVHRPSEALALLAQQHATAVVGPGTGLLGDTDLPRLEPAGSPVVGLVRRSLQALLTGVVPGPLTPLYLRQPDAVEPAARKSVLG